MEFFIPVAKSDEQAAGVYKAIKDHLRDEMGAVFSDRRVFALSYVHNGKAYSAEVGKPEHGAGEVVIAILFEPVRSLYHVCTPSRGVVGGTSILVGANEVRTSTDFGTNGG
ncbi:hypothetical protein ACPPVV_18755 [Rhodanobacter sp. Col0626]|uniref:hypothetical protein n=1 Tax=Rhodanobacter sp. Col0626 TaxID=3415679 RepID=UPI003CECA1EA